MASLKKLIEEIEILFNSYESPQKIVDAKGFRSNHTIVCINYNYGKMFNSININGRTLYLHINVGVRVVIFVLI